MSEREGQLSDLEVAKAITKRVLALAGCEVQMVVPDPTKAGSIIAFDMRGRYAFTFDRAAMRFHIHHGLETPITSQDVQIFPHPLPSSHVEPQSLPHC